MTKEYEIVELPTGSLVSRKSNPREHTEDQIERLGESMDDFGFSRPILVDETKTVIAGHGRLMSARRKKLSTVPCIIATGWTEEEKKAYMIADNRLGELSTWDTAGLENELRELENVAHLFGDVDKLEESLPQPEPEKKQVMDVAAGPKLLRAGKMVIEITSEENARLVALLYKYNNQYSLKNGFWKWLLEGAKRARASS